MEITFDELEWCLRVESPCSLEFFLNTSAWPLTETTELLAVCFKLPSPHFLLRCIDNLEIDQLIGLQSDSGSQRGRSLKLQRFKDWIMKDINFKMKRFTVARIRP